MPKRKLGKTDLEVTPLGLGAAEIGVQEGVDEAAAEKVLNGALDAGINLIDTAACYLDSEVKIGNAIGARRDEYVLVTKCGHKKNTELTARNWSAEIITQSLERSLKRLKTDHVDVLLLHSCVAKQLDNEDMLRALEDCKRSGKTRYIGYSGDNEGAEKAVDIDRFDVLETSVNFVDQQAIERYLKTAEEKQLGVLAKRPIANGCWRDESAFDEFYSEYVKPYKERMRKMDLSPDTVGFHGGFPELALRFSAYAPGVTALIVGSTNVDHLKQDLEWIEKGPLDENVQEKIRQAWKKNDDGSWTGQT